MPRALPSPNQSPAPTRLPFPCETNPTPTVLMNSPSEQMQGKNFLNSLLSATPHHLKPNINICPTSHSTGHP